MKEVILYTDGACSGNPGPGGWACLFYKHVDGPTRSRLTAEPLGDAMAAQPTEVLL